MKLLDLLFEAEVALLGDHYYHIDRDELKHTVENLMSSHTFNQIGSDGIGITIHLDQDVTVQGRYWPTAVIQTSLGEQELTCFKLTHTMFKYVTNE